MPGAARRAVLVVALSLASACGDRAGDPSGREPAGASDTEPVASGRERTVSDKGPGDDAVPAPRDVGRGSADRSGARGIGADRITLDADALARTGGVDVEVDEGSVSLLLSFALADAENSLGITRLVAPDGRVVHATRFADDSWEALDFTSDVVAEPLSAVADLALFVPASSDAPLAVGTWRVELETDPPNARFAHATAVLRRDGASATDEATTGGAITDGGLPDGPGTARRVVDVHVHVFHPDARYRGEAFADALDTRWRAALERTLAPHALGIGALTTSAASARETSRLAALDDEREIGRACRATRRAGRAARGPAGTDDATPVLHAGLVREISAALVWSGLADDAADDGGALTGLAPQPGLPFDDESANGCVFVAEGPWREPSADGDALDEATVVELLAANLLHELGHFAGLAHPSEADGVTFDLIDDTPRCTSPDVEICGVAGGADNLMFHTGDERTLPWTLTAGQAAVLRVHPLFRPDADTER